ncbi:GntR family transcriptional regulator [Streptomyces subrutilus]|uniref:GntR family transcriptional regulator n=1 Tax=Streptomyces subrutilus TaxID=36818 RepID=A0A5P2UTX8_9ACTN|nr:GntR family transcriptional regulator [Streptomyces subrutilus]QEU82573.1 GntR family transcriptional regulator [Streptomyces subrutilus]WSJ27947.1 GntR family transcriptional regulator [Streptomyces subrutilus]GGZ82225.1 GntR family transcriptional regulator [Streptomyces subrutilus]
MATRPSDRQPLADQMYEVLLDQFMDGLWSPGRPLNIGALSRELNVSQTPLREALARLEHTGLVRREALKGYRVAPLFSETELIKLMDARLVLEPTLTYEAGRRTTPEFLQDVADSIEELRNCAAGDGSKSVRAYLSADERFHFLIAKQSANPFLESAYRSLSGHVQRFRLFAELGSSDAQSPARDHAAVYDALAAGDAEGAADRMRRHIENAKARALKDRQAVTGG